MKNNTAKKKRILPDTWLIVFGILLVIAALSWIVPSGTFEYEMMDVIDLKCNCALSTLGCSFFNVSRYWFLWKY